MKEIKEVLGRGYAINLERRSLEMKDFRLLHSLPSF